jgi:hypothetical protein
MKWDLEDVEKAASIVQYKSDTMAAQSEYVSDKLKNNNKVNK